MYTITFYSYKGCVGRSLALANVGSQLALTGRKVLLVDFDLEAPALTRSIMKRMLKSWANWGAFTLSLEEMIQR